MLCMSLPDQLRSARLAANLTQAQLAQRVGVADGTRIAAWESGRAEPHPRLWLVVCEVLGIPPVDPEDVTLRAARLRRGMTRAELALALGVHASTVKRWEEGSSRPTARHRDVLQDLFGPSLNMQDQH